MGFDAKAGVFALNTGTGNQSVSGVGFQPKIVIFLPTDDTANGVLVDTHFGMGVGISSSERWAFTANDEDAQGTSDSHQESSNALCIVHNDPGEATADYEADFVSLDADGFTINITTAPGTAKRVGYLALGGSDLTNVAAGGFNGDNALGTQAVTGVGFQPDAVIFASIGRGAAVTNGTAFTPSVGLAVSPTQRGCTAGASQSGQATSDTARQQRTDACILIIQAPGAIIGEADFSSFDADGFTIDWSDANNSFVFYLCLKGGQYAVGDVTSQTGTGEWSETGVGFTPAAGLFASFCNAANGGEVDDLKLSLGVATSSGDRFVAGCVSEDNQATTDCDNYQDDALMYQNYDFAQGVLGAADFVSWDADGFTLDQTDADPTGNQILYLVMGALAVAGNPWYAYAQQ